MPSRRRPTRRPLGYFDAQDKMMGLRRIYQTASFSDKARLPMVQRLHRELDDVALPEPDEELEDSELSDSERRDAIAREKARREGLT